MRQSALVLIEMVQSPLGRSGVKFDHAERMPFEACDWGQRVTRRPQRHVRRPHRTRQGRVGAVG